MTEPTDAETLDLWESFVGEPTEEIPLSNSDKLCFARAVLRSWGAAEHYRNAIASACEGWTMPDGLRNHLETALWSPPTPQPTQPESGAVPMTVEQVRAILLEAGYGSYKAPVPERAAFISGLRHSERANGINAKEAGNAE